jgi:hypothetical protein
MTCEDFVIIQPTVATAARQATTHGENLLVHTHGAETVLIFRKDIKYPCYRRYTQATRVLVVCLWSRPNQCSCLVTVLTDMLGEAACCVLCALTGSCMCCSCAFCTGESVCISAYDVLPRPVSGFCFTKHAFSARFVRLHNAIPGPSLHTRNESLSVIAKALTNESSQPRKVSYSSIESKACITHVPPARRDGDTRYGAALTVLDISLMRATIKSSVSARPYRDMRDHRTTTGYFASTA